MGLWNLFQFRLEPKGLIILRALTLGLLGLNLSELVHFYGFQIGPNWLNGFDFEIGLVDLIWA